MSSLDELKRLARSHQQRVDNELNIPCTIEASSDLPSNKARVWRPDIRQEVIVNSLIRTAGIEGWIRLMPNQEYQFFAPDIPASDVKFKESLNATLVSQGAHETVADSITGLHLVDGRVEPSPDGGLLIHVNAFDHEGGRWNGEPTFDDFDMTPSVVVGSGNARFVKIILDPATNSLSAYAGTELTGDRSNLTTAVLAAIDVPAGVYVLGAVALVYGQTTISATDIVDTRFHLATTSPILFAQTTDQTIANTTTETTLFGMGQGSLTPPTGSLAAGISFDITLSGDHTTKAATAGTLRLRLKLGGTLLADTGALTLTDNLTGGWEFTGRISIRTSGAMVDVRAWGRLTMQSGNKTIDTFRLLQSGVISYDNTVSPAIDLTVQFGTANAANSLTSHEGMVERRNAA